MILSVCTDDNFSKYNGIENELDGIYEHIIEGICIRSKGNWWELSEKSTVFFEFRKTTRSSKSNEKVIADDKATIDQTHILECTKEFYKLHFYKKLQQKLKVFSDISLLKNFLKKLLYNSLKNIQNDKSAGNDGLTKEFYGTHFCNELEEIFVDSVSEAKKKGHSSTSQRLTIVRLKIK